MNKSHYFRYYEKHYIYLKAPAKSCLDCMFSRAVTCLITHTGFYTETLPKGVVPHYLSQRASPVTTTRLNNRVQICRQILCVSSASIWELWEDLSFFFSSETWLKAFRSVTTSCFSIGFNMLRDIFPTRERATGGGREPGWSTGHCHLQAGCPMATTSEHSGMQTKWWRLTVAGCHWSQCKVIQPLQLVPGKVTMKFQLSLPSIYSLCWRRICCTYKGGGQMINSDSFLPFLTSSIVKNTQDSNLIQIPKVLSMPHFFFFQMDITACSESCKDGNWFWTLLSLVPWGQNGKQRGDSVNSNVCSRVSN